MTRIEALTPYDSRQSGQERWFVGHESDEAAAYLVKLTPDGRGRTTFTVQHEPAAPKKATQ